MVIYLNQNLIQCGHVKLVVVIETKYENDMKDVEKVQNKIKELTGQFNTKNGDVDNLKGKYPNFEPYITQRTQFNANITNDQLNNIVKEFSVCILYSTYKLRLHNMLQFFFVFLTYHRALKIVFEIK